MRDSRHQGLPGVMGLFLAGEGRVGVVLTHMPLGLSRRQNSLGTDRCYIPQQGGLNHEVMWEGHQGLPVVSSARTLIWGSCGCKDRSQISSQRLGEVAWSAEPLSSSCLRLFF